MPGSDIRSLVTVVIVKAPALLAPTPSAAAAVAKTMSARTRDHGSNAFIFLYLPILLMANGPVPTGVRSVAPHPSSTRDA
jgi:hypothetical protein